MVPNLTEHQNGNLASARQCLDSALAKDNSRNSCNDTMQHSRLLSDSSNAGSSQAHLQESSRVQSLTPAEKTHEPQGGFKGLTQEIDKATYKGSYYKPDYSKIDEKQRMRSRSNSRTTHLHQKESTPIVDSYYRNYEENKNRDTSKSSTTLSQFRQRQSSDGCPNTYKPDNRSGKHNLTRRSYADRGPGDSKEIDRLSDYKGSYYKPNYNQDTSKKRQRSRSVSKTATQTQSHQAKVDSYYPNYNQNPQKTVSNRLNTYRPTDTNRPDRNLHSERRYATPSVEKNETFSVDAVNTSNKLVAHFIRKSLDKKSRLNAY